MRESLILDHLLDYCSSPSLKLVKSVTSNLAKIVCGRQTAERLANSLGLKVRLPVQPVPDRDPHMHHDWLSAQTTPFLLLLEELDHLIFLALVNSEWEKRRREALEM
jgi:hypothetical protein